MGTIFMMNKKKLTIIISLGVLILAVLAVVVWQGFFAHPKNLINYKDPQLTADQKQLIEARIASLQEQISKADAKNPEEMHKLYAALAAEYYPLGEYAKSRDAYLQALKFKDDMPMTYYALATVDYAMTDYGAAMEHIDKALEATPEDANYWRFKIEVAKKMEWNQAKIATLYEDALRATKDHVDISVSHALYLTDIGDLQGAVAQWRHAIERDPSRKASFEAEIEKLRSRLQ